GVYPMANVARGGGFQGEESSYVPGQSLDSAESSLEVGDRRPECRGVRDGNLACRLCGQNGSLDIVELRPQIHHYLSSLICVGYGFVQLSLDGRNDSLYVC